MNHAIFNQIDPSLIKALEEKYQAWLGDSYGEADAHELVENAIILYGGEFGKVNQGNQEDVALAIAWYIKRLNRLSFCSDPLAATPRVPTPELPGVAPAATEQPPEGAFAWLAESMLTANQGSVQAEGGEVGLTPPSNHTHKLRTGGEDTAEISLYVNWPDHWDRIRKELELAKLAAEQSGDGFKGDIVKINGREMVVRPSGAKTSGGGPFFKWVVEHNGYVIKIQDKPQIDPECTQPNVMVAIGSIPLMLHGFKAIWDDIEDFFADLEVEIMEDKLSRIDPCVDLVGDYIAEFGFAKMSNKTICRATKTAVYFSGNHIEGVSFGRGQIMMRAYDKAREVREKVEERKLEALITRRWGQHTQTALRVEFQLRREALKSFKVSSVQDWFDKRASVCAYLVMKWFRLTSEEVDRDNPDRTPISKTWELVEDAFADWTGKADPQDRIHDQEPDAEALTRQATGCFASAVCLTMHTIPNTIEEFCGEVTERVYQLINEQPKKFMQKLRKRRIDFGASGHLTGLEMAGAA